MCGIAGYFGGDAAVSRRIPSALERMRRRGPDSSNFSIHSSQGGNQVMLLHSRLGILDLDPRSNQPFEASGCSLVFNGEIYNYLELRAELENLGHFFRTSSDTEVLLHSYLEFGEDCVLRFEGMWAFALWDSRRNRLFLSRDRFGEKPLYFAQRSEGFYFASETSILRTLAGWTPEVNRRQIVRYLIQGYKSLYKHGETFYEGVCEIQSAQSGFVDDRLELARSSYWSPQVNVNDEMTLEEAVEGTRARLLESVRIRLRSDVPLAFCLSGGVDSSALVSIAAKVFNCRASTFSIIDSDQRYNELDNIRATVADTGVDAHYLQVLQEEALPRLQKLIAYHDAPLATTTYYVHSMITEQVAKRGVRVVFSGTSADELFTGYYDHFLLHLNELEGTPHYHEALTAWKAHTLGFVRNPILRNPRLYAENPRFRDHVYDNSAEFAGFLRTDAVEEFTEETYCPSLLRNRMLNELFHEATPVILHEDDLNSMCYSIENRSPYLDSRLVSFAYTIPARHLIREGHGKYVLRESMKGILNDQVRLDRRKKGFNASINSVIDLKNPEIRAYVLDPRSLLASILDLDKVVPLLDLDHAPNHYSKFLFNLVNARIFLDTAK
jgi:asparagine synthase (glutamine-hydrolysing)